MTATVLDRLRRLLGLGRVDDVERQYGAIPYRRTADGLVFLLVTSRRTRRWIFPKGAPIPLLSPAACAEQEAYEEAGVEGKVAERPLGSYQGTKLRAGDANTIEVEMYPLEVEVELEDWPERGQRSRHWAALEETCTLLSEPDLVALVRDFAAEEGARADAAGDAGRPPE